MYLEATFKEYKLHHNQGEASYVFKEEPYDLKYSSIQNMRFLPILVQGKELLEICSLQ